LIANNKLDIYPKLVESQPQTTEQYDRDKHIHASWHKHDYLLENWLQEKGYYQKARILPEEISYAVVEKIESRDQWEEKRMRGFNLETENAGDEKVKRLEITDKNQIETCLREYRYHWLLGETLTSNNESDDRYLIGFYGEDQEHLEYGSFAGDNVPDFIKAYFAE